MDQVNKQSTPSLPSGNYIAEIVFCEVSNHKNSHTVVRWDLIITHASGQEHRVQKWNNLTTDKAREYLDREFSLLGIEGVTEDTLFVKANECIGKKVKVALEADNGHGFSTVRITGAV